MTYRAWSLHWHTPVYFPYIYIKIYSVYHCVFSLLISHSGMYIYKHILEICQNIMFFRCQESLVLLKILEHYRRIMNNVQTLSTCPFCSTNTPIITRLINILNWNVSRISNEKRSQYYTNNIMHWESKLNSNWLLSC